MQVVNVLIIRGFSSAVLAGGAIFYATNVVICKAQTTLKVVRQSSLLGQILFCSQKAASTLLKTIREVHHICRIGEQRLAAYSTIVIAWAPRA